MEALLPFTISILIGLLVGIERERSHPAQGAMGVRTFLLISLLGFLAGWIQNIWVGIITSVFALSIILFSYVTSVRSPRNHSKHDRGMTTEIAAAVIFALGFTSHQDPALVALIGPLVALVLFSKKSLHRFTALIKPSELEAAILLLLIGVSVVSVLEDKVVDPWGLFNPKKFGMLILMLAVLEFSSYLAIKFLGARKGPYVIGFLGGLVSSTAVTLSIAREANKSPESWRRLSGTVLIAKVASLSELILIVAFVAPSLLLLAAPPILAAIFVGVTAVVILERVPQSSSHQMQLPSPLDLKGVLRLAILLAAILAAVGVTRRLLGEDATALVTFLAALFEAHGSALATVTLFEQGNLSERAAVGNLILVAAASMVAKIGICWVIDRGRFAKMASVVFFIMCLVLGFTWWTIHLL